MSRVAPLITAFNSGKWSPFMEGRLDVEKYPRSCRELQNYIVRPQGPAERRPGLKRLAAAKMSDRAARLMKFEFNDEQAYLLECGHDGTSGYVRIGKDRLQITVEATDAAITNGTFDSNITGWSTVAGSPAHDATKSAMKLPASAHAEQSVTLTDTGQEHVLRFYIDGVAGDTVTVRVGTTSGGQEILADTERAVGYHALPFTPTASPIHIGFKNAGSRDIWVDDVAFVEGVLELGSPWAAADLFRIKRAQSADVLFGTAPGAWFHELGRRSHTDWSLTKFEFKDGPYIEENTDSAKTLTASATSGSGVTVSATGHEPFDANDFGRLVRIGSGYGVITGFTSTTQVTVDVINAFPSTSANSAWRLGLYSDTTGHPRGVTLHQQRLVLTGAGARPSRIDGSKAADFNVFEPATDDDDAYAYLVSDGEVNNGRWLASQKRLVMGAVGAGFRATGETDTAPLTPTAVQINKEIGIGFADLEPLVTSNAILAVQRAGRKIREVGFSFEADGLQAPEISILGEDLLEGGIADWCYCAEPIGTIWIARNDGHLVAFTYEREEKVIAGHEHPLQVDATVESVCSLPGPNGDELYLSICRTVGGSEVRSIEYMEDMPERGADPQVASFYVDSGLTLDNKPAAALTPGATTGSGVTFTADASVFVSGDVGQFIRYRYKTRNALQKWQWNTAKAVITGFTSATQVTCDIELAFPSTDAIASGSWRLTVSSVSGLDHLEGKEVQILGDGAVLDNQTVASGSVNLSSKAACVHVGLAYVSILLPQRFEAGAREGTAQRARKRPFEVGVRFDRTLGAKVGRSMDDLTEIPFRKISDPMDEPVPLFTGTKVQNFSGQHDLDGDVYVVQDQPLPCCVVWMAPRMEVGEK